MRMPARRHVMSGVGWPVGAGRLGAMGVNGQRVIGNLKTLGLGHSLLSFFNLGVVELLHPASVQADQMIVVLAFVDLVDGLA